MHVRARNVNDAFSMALTSLIGHHDERNSRVGPIIAAPGPCFIEYERPMERVLFSPTRNANPVFHLLESLWMLAGRNDLKFPATIIKSMKNFSDDGKVLWGAYGFRWRQFFGYDQIDWIVDELKANPDSRRCVMSMWNAMDLAEHDATTGHIPDAAYRPDLYVATHGGKDVPCNTHIYFDCRGGKLNMTVCNRSNDLVWGCFGANVVHMSILQEYMALAIGIPLGVYRQFTNDLHVYTEKYPLDVLEVMTHEATPHDMYIRGAHPLPLWSTDFGEIQADFDGDVSDFFNAFDTVGIDNLMIAGVVYRTEFFNSTVLPMLRAWRARKNFDGAPRLAEKIAAPDWSYATKAWLLRNQK